MSDAILEARGVTVRYGLRTVLEVDQLAVQQGETLALIGPNGAGKSTLLRILGLLERPTEGEVRLDGQLVAWGRDLLAARRRFASVFQEPLLADTTVERNVALGLTLRRTSGGEVGRRAARWMNRLGISNLASRQARTLSGGEAQRASLARAFAIEPAVLLLDEPFSALDPPTRDDLLLDLQRILRQTAVTTVFVTHDRNEALRVGDRVGVILAGRLAQLGPPEVVFGRPASPEVARFVGVENLLPGRVARARGGLLTVDTGSLAIRVPGELPVGRSVLVCVRPEDVLLRAQSSGPVRDSALNHFAGRVSELVPVGTQVRVVVDCGYPLVAMVTRLSVQELPLAVGSAVTVSFKASAVHLIEREPIGRS
ncbi:MAG TPA: ABC transporter ATP-binding protein [Methylomirabilota bacterium]|nr:ABC transporter ATP-binding protein [Methylomirabilota bacterium]